MRASAAQGRLSNLGPRVFLCRLDSPGRLFRGRAAAPSSCPAVRVWRSERAVSASARASSASAWAASTCPAIFPGQPCGFLRTLLCGEPGSLLPVSGAPRGIPLVLGVATQ